MHESALPVGDRTVDVRFDAVDPDRSGPDHRPEPHPVADKAATRVVAEGSGEQPRPGEHLEAVTDADHRRPTVDGGAKWVTEGDAEIEGEQSTGAERVAVAESTRHDDQCRPIEWRWIISEFRGEPDGRVGSGHLEGEGDVGVAVGSWTGDDERGWSCHLVPPV